MKEEVDFSKMSLQELERALAEKKIGLAEIDLRLAKIKARKKNLQGLLESVKTHEDWFKSLTPPFNLQLNDCSRLHKLWECIQEKKFFDGEVGDFIEDGAYSPMQGKAHVFLVQHDWAAAFEGAVGIGDEYKLPFDLCAFELRIAGQTVIAFAKPATDHYGVDLCICYEGLYGVWMTFKDEANQPIEAYVTSQVKAICIALEAQVAEYGTVKAPSKVNKKRAASGKPLISDFHRVDLSRRLRTARSPNPLHTGRKVRLHFRRGHWRHYEKAAKWINWMLVGDPDLGFIQKQYAI